MIVWGMIRSTSDELDRDTLIKAITHTGQRQSVRLTDSKKVHRFGPSFWSTRRNHLHRSNQVNCDDDDAITDDKDSKIGDSLDEDIQHGSHLKKRRIRQLPRSPRSWSFRPQIMHYFHFKLSLSVGWVIYGYVKGNPIVADKVGFEKVRIPIL